MGSNTHEDSFSYGNDPEVHKLTLDPDSGLFDVLCKPKNPPMPSSTLVSGSGTATFDATYGAPYCQGSSTSCDSGALLEGRFGETNAPNTIDGCMDGPSDGTDERSDDTVTFTESVKKIIVESAKAGNSLRGGELATIRATVVTNHVKDRVDFYFSNNASSDNPNFTFITIKLLRPLLGITKWYFPANLTHKFNSLCHHALKKQDANLQCVLLYVHHGKNNGGMACMDS